MVTEREFGRARLTLVQGDILEGKNRLARIGFDRVVGFLRHPQEVMVEHPDRVPDGPPGVGAADASVPPANRPRRHPPRRSPQRPNRSCDKRTSCGATVSPGARWWSSRGSRAGARHGDT